MQAAFLCQRLGSVPPGAPQRPPPVHTPAHVEDGDDTRTIRAKVTGQVLTLDAALQEVLPALLGLLDTLPDGHPALRYTLHRTAVGLTSFARRLAA